MSNKVIDRPGSNTGGGPRTWAVLAVAVAVFALLVGCGMRLQTAGVDFSLGPIEASWRLYYLIALLIIVGTMVPFFVSFERREARSRELVVLATLAALAVAGRVAFFFLPQFKPVCAIVTIAGVCFGGESGFLVGAVAGFVSNFFFGQGPYTPWQMFCFGIVGFAAGLLFHRGPLKAGRLSLCLYGGLSTFLLYGGFINLGSLLIMGFPLTPASIVACYASALPFDLVHAAASVFFLFVLGRPLIDKIDRVKAKYGLG